MRRSSCSMTGQREITLMTRGGNAAAAVISQVRSRSTSTITLHGRGALVAGMVTTLPAKAGSFSSHVCGLAPRYGLTAQFKPEYQHYGARGTLSAPRHRE